MCIKPGEHTGKLAAEKHVKYILSVQKKKNSNESVALEYLRMNGAYWGLTTLDLLGKLDTVDKDEVISWIMQCRHESGGFAGNIGYDPHMLYTLSVVQVLALFDKLDVLDVDKVSNWDVWGEVDTQYIVRCKNMDGGFGCTPGAESHAGQIFCCVGALAITGNLHYVDKDLLGWWLCERQVCYSWWVLSSLIMIDRVHWIDKEKLINFILDAQDVENGGISDRPEDAVDMFHTYFGVAGLSFLQYPGLKDVDPAYALPIDALKGILFQK
ncbi:hypothetical protein ACFE04_013679 [Oxalis oulophora]